MRPAGNGSAQVQVQVQVTINDDVSMLMSNSERDWLKLTNHHWR